MERRARVEAIVAPLVAGLVVMITLLGLIGTAIRDPRPHDIRVGIVGPEQAAAQLGAGLNSNAPGTFQLTTYDSPNRATSALDRVLTLYLGPGCSFPGMRTEQAHRIGDVARAAGVNVETLRYYERRGLLRPSRALPEMSART